MNKNFELFENTKTKFYVTASAACYGALIFHIESSKFVGQGPIYLTKENIQRNIILLHQFLNSYKGKIDFKDEESDVYFVSFEFVNRVLKVNGCVGDYNMNNLSFGFDADQTLLQRLLSFLENSIDNI